MHKRIIQTFSWRTKTELFLRVFIIGIIAIKTIYSRRLLIVLYLFDTIFWRWNPNCFFFFLIIIAYKLISSSIPASKHKHQIQMFIFKVHTHLVYVCLKRHRLESINDPVSWVHVTVRISQTPYRFIKEKHRKLEISQWRLSNQKQAKLLNISLNNIVKFARRRNWHTVLILIVSRYCHKGPILCTDHLAVKKTFILSFELKCDYLVIVNH